MGKERKCVEKFITKFSFIFLFHRYFKIRRHCHQFIYFIKNKMKTFSILFLALTSFSLAERCKHPQVASNYKNSLYAGRWYEIGKVSNK